MKILVTAGPTYEPLDGVRRLTNFSTGRLGSELAEFLVVSGHQVTLMRGEQATWTASVKAPVVPFSTTSDLRDRLKAAASEGFQAVFHAAAVSDFTFGKVWQRAANGDLTPVESKKISSRLQNLIAELLPTPKVIAELRDWYPNALLVGWKYEVEGGRDSVLAQARQQIAECRTNASVANGPAYGSGFGVVSMALRHCATRQELFEALLAILPKPGQ